MLSDNIKRLRKEKGISQEELAEKLNVVRQTVSKWENGLSVPDAEMLIRIANALDTTVSILLNSTNTDFDSAMTAGEERLEIITNDVATQKEKRRKLWLIIFCFALIVSVILLVCSLVNLIYYKTVVNGISTNMSIIGGYVGPTNIFVISKTGSLVFFISVLITVIISIVGICKTRKI